MKYTIEIYRQQSATMIVEVPDGTLLRDVYKLARRGDFSAIMRDVIADAFDADDPRIDSVQEATPADVETYGVNFVLPDPAPAATPGAGDQ